MSNASSFPDYAVSTLRTLVIDGVAAAIRQTGRAPADTDQVAQVVREEMKAFLFDETYASEREVILLGSLDPRYVLASVIAGVLGKVRWSPIVVS